MRILMIVLWITCGAINMAGAIYNFTSCQYLFGSFSAMWVIVAICRIVYFAYKKED